MAEFDWVHFCAALLVSGCSLMSVSASFRRLTFSVFNAMRVALFLPVRISHMSATLKLSLRRGEVSPVNGTSASGLPADERLVSLGGAPGARRRFPETPLTPCDADFLTLAQTVSQSAGPGASVPCVRHGSQAADVDRRQLVYPSLERLTCLT